MHTNTEIQKYNHVKIQIYKKTYLINNKFKFIFIKRFTFKK